MISPTCRSSGSEYFSGLLSPIATAPACSSRIASARPSTVSCIAFLQLGDDVLIDVCRVLFAPVPATGFTRPPGARLGRRHFRLGGGQRHDLGGSKLRPLPPGVVVVVVLPVEVEPKDRREFTAFAASYQHAEAANVERCGVFRGLLNVPG